MSAIPLGLALAQINPVRGALRAGVRLGLEFGDLEARAGHAPQQAWFGRGQPEGDAAPGGERAPDHLQAFAPVKADVLREHERARPVIDVEHDAVVGARFGLADAVENVADVDLGARIIEERPVVPGKEFPDAAWEAAKGLS